MLHVNSDFLIDNNAENTILGTEGKFYSIDHESFSHSKSRRRLYKTLDITTLLSSLIALSSYKYAAFVTGYFEGYYCNYDKAKIVSTTRLFSLRKLVFDVKNGFNTITNMSSLESLIPS